jgi:antagonist of KipI
VLRIVDGPDAARLRRGEPWDAFLFRVAPHHDRIGIRLDGMAVPVEADPERLSAPVAPGAVQVAGGSLIVLGVACGTMGGYPHVAHVITADVWRSGQLRAGDRVTFQSVSPSEARRLDREQRQGDAERIRLLAAGCGTT